MADFSQEWPGERIEKLNFLVRAAEGIPDCALADVPALVRF